MKGAVRRSKRSTHFLVRAFPEVMAERAGQEMRATASEGKGESPKIGRLLVLAAT
jgi:hypothetical protein